MHNLMEWECITLKDVDNNINENDKNLKSKIPAADIKVDDAPTSENPPAIEPISGKYVWKIEGWSNITVPYIYCNKFSVGSVNWVLKILLKGNTPIGISAFPSYQSCPRPVYAQCNFVLMDQVNGNHKSVEGYPASYLGQVQIFSTNNLFSDFHDPTKGFLVNDSCVIEATVTVLNYFAYLLKEPRP
ncbi:hypothetical protein GIB67_011321 [Kingdonia uniflora]|uniref:MATH domain-containing protein n=1 Tax=Kingdonia uniflora TaxID=39325 RepID=A0A7J7MP06_9MAGN|nr:hypothetical protein GIB67_011321 [Kingdonia uniflora]